MFVNELHSFLIVNFATIFFVLFLSRFLLYVCFYLETLDADFITLQMTSNFYFCIEHNKKKICEGATIQLFLWKISLSVYLYQFECANMTVTHDF